MGAPGERERDIVEVLAAEAGAARHGGDNGIAVVSEADLRAAMGHISQTAAMLEKESEAIARQHFRAAFEVVDEACEGEIPGDRLGEVLAHLGWPSDASSVADARQALDPSSKGEIDATAFVDWAVRRTEQGSGEDERETAAATKLQAVTRGRTVRRETKEQKESATKVQAVVRGNAARRETSKQKESAAKEAAAKKQKALETAVQHSLVIDALHDEYGQDEGEARFRELFERLDADHSGGLDKDEFANALRVRAKDFPKLAAQLAKYGADALFELWDVNSDGACRSAG